MLQGHFICPSVSRNEFEGLRGFGPGVGRKTKPRHHDLGISELGHQRAVFPPIINFFENEYRLTKNESIQIGDRDWQPHSAKD